MVSLLKYVEKMILDEVPKTDIVRGNSTLTISVWGCGEDLRFYVNFVIKTFGDKGFSLEGHINMIDAYQDSTDVWWHLKANKTQSVMYKFGAFGFVYDFNDGPSQNWEEMYEMILMMREEIDKGKDEKDGEKGDEKQKDKSRTIRSTATNYVAPGLTPVLPVPPEKRAALDARPYTPANTPDKVRLYIIKNHNFIIRRDSNTDFTLVGKDVDGVMFPLTSEHVTQEDIDFCLEAGLKVPQELAAVMTKSALKR